MEAFGLALSGSNTMGWKLQQQQMNPIKTDLPAGPSWLLKFIRCTCKATSRNPCSTYSCTCRKNGLACVEACKGCHGEVCSNLETEFEDHSEDLDEYRNIFDMFETIV